MLGLDHLDRRAAEAFDGYLVLEGSGPQVRSPVPGADLRGRVSSRALLRYYRRAGDRGRARDRRAAACRPDGTNRRRGVVQGEGPGSGIHQAHRYCSGEAGRENGLADRGASQPRDQDVRVDDDLVKQHERMLTDGFLRRSDVELRRVHRAGEERRPFAIDGLRAIQLSRADLLDALYRGRRALTSEEWRQLLLRSVGTGAGAPCPSGRSLWRSSAWRRSSSGTSTWSSLGPGGPERATSTSRYPPMRISSPAARQRWRRCS